MINEEALENAEFLQTNMEKKTTSHILSAGCSGNTKLGKYINGNFGQLLETKLHYSEEMSWEKNFLKGRNKMTYVEEIVNLRRPTQHCIDVLIKC